MQVLVRRTRQAMDLPLPAPATRWSAGADLRAAVVEPVVLAPGERLLVPSGIAIALPEGYEAQVRPRSGLAIRQGITCLNSPGTIDADYRGEIQVILANTGREPVTIRRGDRIAQMVVQKLPEVRFVEAEELPETGRGEGGFGHTGVK